MNPVGALVGSAIGAAVAIVVWVIVGTMSDFYSHWLAVAVGGAAGLGARQLSRDFPPMLAGVCASVVAIFGIFIAKLVLFQIAVNAEPLPDDFARHENVLGAHMLINAYEQGIPEDEILLHPGLLTAAEDAYAAYTPEEIRRYHFRPDVQYPDYHKVHLAFQIVEEMMSEVRFPDWPQREGGRWLPPHFGDTIWNDVEARWAAMSEFDRLSYTTSVDATIDAEMQRFYERFPAEDPLRGQAAGLFGPLDILWAALAVAFGFAIGRMAED